MGTDRLLIPTCVMGAALAAGCSGSDAAPPDTGDASANEASTDALDELFQDGTPEDIAAELEAMTDAGGDEPGATPIYKGVTV